MWVRPQKDADPLGGYLGALSSSFAYDRVGFAWASFMEAALIASVVSFGEFNFLGTRKLLGTRQFRGTQKFLGTPKFLGTRKLLGNSKAFGELESFWELGS